MSTRYHDFVAAHQEASQHLDAERRFANERGRPEFSVALCGAEIAELECRLAVQQGAAAFNRSAPDTETVRKFVEAELKLAREAFVTAEAGVPGVPPLTSATPEALETHVAACLQRATAIAATESAIMATRQRLVVAYGASRDAVMLLAAERKAAGLPRPKAMVPPLRDSAPLGSTRWELGGPPGTADDCDEALQQIKAQRHPLQGTAPSSLETQLAEKRNELERHEEMLAKQAAEREAAKVEHKRYHGPVDVRSTAVRG